MGGISTGQVLAWAILSGSKLCGWMLRNTSAMILKFRTSLDLIDPVNCYLQCLINALLFSAFSFIIMVGCRFCIGGIELLRWLKFWPLASKLWNTSPTAVAKKSTAYHVVRVLVIHKRWCDKLHGTPFIDDTWCFESDARQYFEYKDLVGHLGWLEQNSGIFRAVLSWNRNVVGTYRKAIGLIHVINVGMCEFLQLSLNVSLSFA